MRIRNSNDGGPEGAFDHQPKTIFSGRIGSVTHLKDEDHHYEI